MGTCIDTPAANSAVVRPQSAPISRTNGSSAAERVHHWFELHAHETPAHPAVVFEQRHLSYHELNARANQLAHRLRRLGVVPDAIVGLRVERSPEMFIGILAILKAGGAYLPIDPAYPLERQQAMLSDSRVSLLLTQGHLAPLQFNGEPILLDAAHPIDPGEPITNPLPVNAPADLAYVIYTSGSSGRPKGVMVTHGNLIHSTQARFSCYPSRVDSFLLLSSYSFDSSVAGIFWTLCQGGTLILPHEYSQQTGTELAELIWRHRVTHLLCLPSLYSVLLDQFRSLSSLRTVIVAGESCPPSLVERHFTLVPHAALYNEYGPTEAAVWSSVHRCEPAGAVGGRTVPIGKPIPGTRIHVLDSDLKPVPDGTPGELHIGGPGVARGYLNQPELTQSRFFPDPFASEADARLYRTGDLGRLLPDGSIEFLGRVDNQVKIRGHRVELEEIESVLKRHPAIQEAVVILRQKPDAGEELLGYLVMKPGQGATAAELQALCEAKLPQFMIPSGFLLLERLPTHPNGKVDRQSLPEPPAPAVNTDPVQTEPRNPVEARLAGIWAGLLRVEKVGPHDNFFRLGGHSLLALQVMCKVREEFQSDLPLKVLFDSPTVAGLAAAISTHASRAPRIVPRPRTVSARTPEPEIQP